MLIVAFVRFDPTNTYWDPACAAPGFRYWPKLPYALGPKVVEFLSTRLGAQLRFERQAREIVDKFVISVTELEGVRFAALWAAPLAGAAGAVVKSACAGAA